MSSSPRPPDDRDASGAEKETEPVVATLIPEEPPARALEERQARWFAERERFEARHPRSRSSTQTDHVQAPES